MRPRATTPLKKTASSLASVGDSVAPAGAAPGSESSKRKGPPQQKAAAKSRRVANKDEMLHDGTGHGAGKAQQRIAWRATSLNKGGPAHVDEAS